MKLAPRLFISYLAVVAVALLVIAISTAFVAPANFSRSVAGIDTLLGTRQPLDGTGSTSDVNPAATPNGFGPGGRGQRMGPGGGGPNGIGGFGGGPGAIEAAVTGGFREALTNALLLGGLAAILAAVLASWLISDRIVNPIRGLVSLSQFIADGHYDRRLIKAGNDEVGELTDSFNQMAATLSETEALRRQLLGDVTHELKTPLASIKGYMEGMEDGVIPATPETFQIIHREASRLQRLVEDLQELSRIEAGQTQIQAQSLAPRALVETIVERMQPQFLDKQIAVTVDGVDPLPTVRADPDRAGQVLTNLLGNALQYTPEDGTVRVQIERDGASVRFAVSDSGVGLEAADLENVFQRFYRVDKSRARASGGSGVGLTIARRLVEAQGGRIWAESAGPGRGSTFAFTLPTG